MGIALGNVSYILNGLKEQKFLIQKGKREFQIINKNELLDKWMMGFEEKLKPALHIGNFRFAGTEDEQNWKQLNLKHHQTFWGSEPAGSIITGYLQPQIFTLYTEETWNNLIKNYHFVPDQNGKIKVYKKFWKENDGHGETIVHPLLAYTDLMNTGNNRCMETAKIIYEQLLKKDI
ncbi:MAG: type IV toxin-antitoxin system AbiEi family antitoxin [Bacteroidia bacterium]|nr:type IV toxin-antitoxin system AbiEi family antitoxin [Bacteroidia bacterium]